MINNNSSKIDVCTLSLITMGIFGEYQIFSFVFLLAAHLHTNTHQVHAKNISSCCKRKSIFSYTSLEKGDIKRARKRRRLREEIIQTTTSKNNFLGMQDARGGNLTYLFFYLKFLGIQNCLNMYQKCSFSSSTSKTYFNGHRYVILSWMLLSASRQNES